MKGHRWLQLWLRPPSIALQDKLVHNSSNTGAYTAQTQHQHPLKCTASPADNVGDNVGDIAGMGADLFGSFAESSCAALILLSVSSLAQEHNYVALSYPLAISAVGILVCVVTTFIATDLKPARLVSDIERTLKLQLVISTLLATPVSSVCCCCFGLLWKSFGEPSGLTST